MVIELHRRGISLVDSLKSL